MMRLLRPNSFMLLFACLLWGGCTSDPDVNYGLQPLTIESDLANKDRVKTVDQWISILHSDLFGTALGTGELYEIKQAFQSVGDQEVAREMLISNFMQQSDVLLPDVTEMTTQTDAFIEATYTRFLVRLPTEAEKTWMRQYIGSNPNLTPELVYTAFALSDEYLHY